MTLWIPRILADYTPPNLRIPRILRILWVVHDEEIVPTSTISSSSCDLESKGKRQIQGATQYAMVWGELNEKK